MRACVLLLGVVVWAAGAAAEEPTPPDRARVRQLVEQLAHESFAVREAAQRELTRFAELATEELTEATRSPDLERARRARRILATLDAASGSRPTHRIVDALDQPIKGARLIVEQDGFKRESVTDYLGRFAVSDPDKRTGAGIVVELRHPAYGVARWQSRFANPARADLVDCKLPVVHQASEARKRAVHGKVVDGAGKPVARAVLRCPHVRTPGEGLMSGDSQAVEVVTDAQGSFALYLAAYRPTTGLPRAHGELVPPRSRYRLAVTAPARDDCFPVEDFFPNGAPVEIRMPLATAFHRFRLVPPDGQELAGPQLKNVFIELHSSRSEVPPLRLSPDEVLKGRKLIPGTYAARQFFNGTMLAYLPVRVDAGSPEELTFRLPSATVYRGRVVHGATGKPLARAWVVGSQGIGRANLAELTEAEWRQLRETPDTAGPKDAAGRILGVHYGVAAMVRTDAEGRFAVTQPAGVTFYGVLAFAEDFLPLEESLTATKRERADVVELGDFPLFPAAKLLVKIASPEKRTLSVSPEWKPETGEQPEWLERFNTAADRSRRHFRYSHWMTLNETRPVFIPSDVRLRVQFASPYDPRWGSVATAVLKAKQGEVVDAGTLELPKSIPVSIRVVDDRGGPVEGLAVRSLQAGQQVWSLAHNTDAKGLAHFFAPPNSSGKFRVELQDRGPALKGPAVEHEYRIREAAPEGPLEIRLTAEHLRNVQGGAARKE